MIGIREKPVLMSYRDYRVYIKDWFEWKQGAGHYTYRNFSQEMGFSSPNQLLLVIQGKRNISKKNLTKYEEVFNLGEREKKYFRMLVSFCQEKNPEAKKEILKQIAPYWIEKGKLISEEEFEFLSRWYYSAIREMVALSDFNDDPDWISKKLKRAITPHQAKVAFNDLVKLNLIKKEGEKWVATSEYVSTGPEVASVSAYDFHNTMIEQAKESFHLDPSARNISSLSFTVRKEDYAFLVEEIQKFKKNTVEYLMSRTEKNKDDALYQLNVQLFPLTDL